MPNVSRGTNAGDKQHYRNKEFLQCLISRLEQLRKESELANISTESSKTEKQGAQRLKDKANNQKWAEDSRSVRQQWWVVYV